MKMPRLESSLLDRIVFKLFLVPIHRCWSEKKTIMTTRRERKAQATRQKILDEARYGFTFRPMNLIGMDAFAGHAGVDRSTINRHFRDKDGLFAAAVERECKLALAEIKLTVEDAKIFPDSLKAFAIARFKETERIFRYRKLNPQKIRSLPRTKIAFDKFMQDERKLLAEIFQSAADAKLIAKRDFANVVEAVLGTLNGFQYIRENGDVADDGIVKIISELIV